MSNDSRLNNSMRNTVYGAVGMLAMLLVSFIGSGYKKYTCSISIYLWQT